MEHRITREHKAAIVVTFIGNLDAAMSAHLSRLVNLAGRNGIAVTISLRHIREIRWNAVCMLKHIIRTWQSKGLDIQITEAQPRIVMLLKYA